jgi:hypothetical protein
MEGHGVVIPRESAGEFRKDLKTLKTKLSSPLSENRAMYSGQKTVIHMVVKASRKLQNGVE